MKIISRSCLIEELKKRLLSKPGSEHAFSIFNSRDKKFDQAQFKAQKAMFADTKLIKKHLTVRFEGLPDIDEEEKQYMTRKPLAKDAKLGAEIENAWKLRYDDEDWPDDELVKKANKKT
jgi:hypothetical protein